MSTPGGQPGKGKWIGRSGFDPPYPPEIEHRLAREREREPIAEVTVRLFSLEPGQAEIRYRVAQDGPLGTRDGRQSPTATYQVLIATIERELRRAWFPPPPSRDEPRQE